MSKATSKVTSKLQVTVPKVIADEVGIKPGDELEWTVTGRSIMVSPTRSETTLTREERLAILDAQTARQREREREYERRFGKIEPGPRDWTRDDLYFDEDGRHR